MRCAFVDYLTENHEEEAMDTARADKVSDFVKKFGLPEASTKQIMDGNMDFIVDALIDAAMANAELLDQVARNIGYLEKATLGNG